MSKAKVAKGVLPSLFKEGCPKGGVVSAIFSLQQLPNYDFSPATTPGYADPSLIRRGVALILPYTNLLRFYFKHSMLTSNSRHHKSLA